MHPRFSEQETISYVHSSVEALGRLFVELDLHTTAFRADDIGLRNSVMPVYSECIGCLHLVESDVIDRWRGAPKGSPEGGLYALRERIAVALMGIADLFLAISDAGSVPDDGSDRSREASGAIRLRGMQAYRDALVELRAVERGLATIMAAGVH